MEKHGLFCFVKDWESNGVASASLTLLELFQEHNSEVCNWFVSNYFIWVWVSHGLTAVALVNAPAQIWVCVCVLAGINSSSVWSLTSRATASKWPKLKITLSGCQTWSNWEETNIFFAQDWSGWPWYLPKSANFINAMLHPLRGCLTNRSIDLWHSLQESFTGTSSKSTWMFILQRWLGAKVLRCCCSHDHAGHCKEPEGNQTHSTTGHEGNSDCSEQARCTCSMSGMSNLVHLYFCNVYYAWT
jgi:hypothetical protein